MSDGRKGEVMRRWVVEVKSPVKAQALPVSGRTRRDAAREALALSGVVRSSDWFRIRVSPSGPVGAFVVLGETRYGDGRTLALLHVR